MIQTARLTDARPRPQSWFLPPFYVAAARAAPCSSASTACSGESFPTTLDAIWK